MPHIPDDELALYAFDAQLAAPERRAAIEREIASCTVCRTTFDFMCVSDQELSDSDVWEPIMSSPTLDALRAHAQRIADEDEEAETLLAPLLADPALMAWTDLASKRRFRTGGVVRRLIAHAANLHEREPLDALTFAEAAISVAEALPENHYPAKAVFEMRGTAWKERANALSYLGRFDEALECCRRAERAYRELLTPELGLSTVAYVRGSILCEKQQYEAANEAATAAERGFCHLGDEERRTRAVHLQGLIAYERGALEKATTLFERVYEHGESVADPLWMARGAQALANCHIDRGNLAHASMHLHMALKLFRTLDLRIEVNRTEWGLARVLLASERVEDAILRLRVVVDVFERAGMITDAALAGLDQADGLVAVGRTREVARLAGHLFEIFSATGMLNGALAAMAYVKETAERGVLLRTHVHAVRRFLRQIERQPELLFVPPPENFL